ncbi:BZ3500_MvSof-1268-A1-R1_Chr9g10572 [Microbotryum saponariae]|uniref:BZ3500_MvSof-1268-A1-R1_Chr9g10572 protein n=1 Tax=Microbotryum saponariae TaxID=289078 RepID=A0A2X0L2E1_9BASI|nr:BZ3501_MvSof-1269-A2-R1_Chr9g10321 [Microbotryum saponariae]SDA00317.1 BZ3500_MvSof-1268-A1-R1_Chr9g10572 [Microbotryum saponariae]
MSVCHASELGRMASRSEWISLSLSLSFLTKLRRGYRRCKTIGLLQWLGQGSKRAVMLSKYTSDPSHTIPIYPVRRITSSRALTRTACVTVSSRPFLPLTGPQAADDKTSIGSPGLPRPQPFFPSRFLQPSMQSPTELVKADALATTMDEWNGMRKREGVAGFMSHGFVSAFFVGSHREAVPFALVSARASSPAKCNATERSEQAVERCGTQGVGRHM